MIEQFQYTDEAMGIHIDSDYLDSEAFDLFIHGDNEHFAITLFSYN